MDPVRPTLSVVVPVHNEQDVLPTLYARLVTALGDLDWELVLVDDGSRDGTWRLVEGLHAADPRVRAVALSRNFGHAVAITAGLELARGEAVVVMDADLQDPPEVVPELVARWRDGADVVYGVREARDGEGWFKVTSAALFYRGLRLLTAIDVPPDVGEFRLLSRRAVEALLQLPERNRYVRGLVSWIGFRQEALPYRRAARAAGVSKYPLGRMLRLASDAVVSFSTVPLQIAVWLGLALSIGCFAYAGYAAGVKLWTGRTVPGWASEMVAILLIGGAQLVCLGIIGEYIGRIYDEVKRRPLYLVQRALGVSVDGTGATTPRGR